ncbi:UNVERIFIED_CONTAM: Kinesin-like protein KIN-7G [Sesamum angustifolium]|uniref:Kinesin-like protein KIN-7G n=1 Tax=Sesamum angustifolium TaxID=2727405 RepID=A0AAW2IL53_9LAMI
MEIMESGRELSRGNEEKIYVSVRLRPLNNNEISSNDVSDCESINHDTIVYKNACLLASERSMDLTAYTFDRVFGSDCSTREVYERGARDVALSVVHGMNCYLLLYAKFWYFFAVATIFAYGQTSSGKTYTMTGITNYAIADIYEYIQTHPERDFVLKFSAMEIYNESVRDLLSADSTPLRLLDDPERGTIVEKLTEEILTDRNHATQLLSVCEAQRQIGETSLNEMSSRSHQIIRLTIESSSHESLGRENASTLEAAVNFVDLAGSERASQSLSAGRRLKEGCHINRSLLTLGTVIRKLCKERNGHIPYRDSKLTRILQPSLGGNARTAIICTMSPAHSHVEQSRNTLIFASCAKEVTTTAQVNVVMSDKPLIKHLQKELARLESELRSSQFNFRPSNYPAILRERDSQIEKLEKEIKDLILQRDIAQAQVKELLQMLGEDASSMAQVGLGNYPHLRVQISPDAEIQEDETPISPDPQFFDVDIKAYSHGYSRSSSEDRFVKVPYLMRIF